MLRQRFYDILLSVYLFNERRGFTYLEQLAEAFAQKFPDDTQTLRSIRKHARDERKHYDLFAGYFERRGYGPYVLNERFGYCDQIVRRIFGKTIGELDPRNIVNNDASFFQLCRLIMITEMRGMEQVGLLLRNILIRNHAELKEIFRVVEKDEPSHCFPYQAWLRKHGQHEPSWREKLADAQVHYSLMLVKLPFLFLNPFLKRA